MNRILDIFYRRSFHGINLQHVTQKTDHSLVQIFRNGKYAGWKYKESLRVIGSSEIRNSAYTNSLSF